MTSCEKHSIHPYEPYIPEGATRLIVGTCPPWRFCNPPHEEKVLAENDVRFYYGSCGNAFWKLLAKATNNPEPICENTDEAIQQRQELLSALGVGITDVVESCLHNNRNSADNDLECIIEKPLKDLLLEPRCKSINILLYTSDFVKSLVNRKYNDKSYHNEIDKDKRKYTLSINGNPYTAIILYSPSPTALRGLGEGGEQKRLQQYKEVFGGQ